MRKHESTWAAFCTHQEHQKAVLKSSPLTHFAHHTLWASKIVNISIASSSIVVIITTSTSSSSSTTTSVAFA